jgi:CTP:molybdopterin cytidylyltransferase MocA
VPSVINKSVFAIVLAAGSASRFGAVKQLAILNDMPLVRYAARLAIDTCGARSVLVTGHEWRAVSDACGPWPGYLVVNEQHGDGIGSSLAIAARVIQHVADAILVILADQPLISPSHIQKLVDAWSGDEHEIIASAYAGIRGAPTLFAHGSFARLASLTGDQGARVLFDDPDSVLRSIDCDDAAVDIDTMDDLTRLERNARS